MYKNLSIEALGISGRQSERIELALSYNFKGLDLDLAELAAESQAQGAARARRYLDSAKLKVSCFRLPISAEADPADAKAALDRLGPLADFAQQLGCTRATTVVEPAGDSRPYHENFEHYRRWLGEVGDRLAPFGIRLGVEFEAAAALRAGRAFQFIHSFDQLLLLVRMVGVPNVGVTLDLWNWHLGGGTLEQLRAFGAEKTVAVYLADVVPGVTADSADDSTRRLPGESGVIDSVAVLALLGELGYDGPVTVRPGAAALAGQSRDKIVKQTAEALDRVWKAAGIGVRPQVAGK